MSALIPSKLIDLAEAEGACSEAIAWLRERPRTFFELAKKDVGWIGWSMRLLNHEAQKAYNEATATALKAYNEATAPALKAYNDATAPAWKAYIEGLVPAWKAYDATTAKAWKTYIEAAAPAQRAYDEAAEKALEDALRRSHPELFEEESCPNQNKP